ncbi:hypothetical protein AB1N83_008428 [Pleurotus pulmonarius]
MPVISDQSSSLDISSNDSILNDCCSDSSRHSYASVQYRLTYSRHPSRRSPETEKRGEGGSERGVHGRKQSSSRRKETYDRPGPVPISKDFIFLITLCFILACFLVIVIRQVAIPIVDEYEYVP